MAEVKLFEININIEEDFADNSARVGVDPDMLEALNVDIEKFQNELNMDVMIASVHEFQRALRVCKNDSED